MIPIKYLSDREEEVLYKLAENLTGSYQVGNKKKEILVDNVIRKMKELKLSSLNSYLHYILRDTLAYQEFISLATIHTTSWFREPACFAYIKNHFKDKKITNLQCWSNACSTGEEVYGLLFYLNREVLPGGDIKILGTDIDPISLSTASTGCYHFDQKPQWLNDYAHCASLNQDLNTALYQLKINQKMKLQCSWALSDLRDPGQLNPPIIWHQEKSYDLIFCRNVLIYFDTEQAVQILKQLAGFSKNHGLIILGNSEYALGKKNPEIFLDRGNGVFEVLHQKKMNKKIERLKFLIIDDSKTVCSQLAKMFRSEQVDVDICYNVQQANDLLEIHRYEMITLDLNLPVMSGPEWLRLKRQSGLMTPVVMISDSTLQDAEKIFGVIGQDAQDYITKSDLSRDNDQIVLRIKEIASHYKSKTENNVLASQHKSQSPNWVESKNQLSPIKMHRAAPFSLKDFKCDIIVIGASTGGPEALANLLSNWPRNSPPIVIVQHIGEEFAKAFSEHLAHRLMLSLDDEFILYLSNMKQGKNRKKCELKPGCIYMAQGSYHLTVTMVNGRPVLDCNDKQGKVHGHRPSIDCLFTSLSQCTGISSLAVLLTGMGEDGALGMKHLYDQGHSLTFVQDKNSSVVYGMPKKAIELEGVCFEGAIEQIRERLLTLISNQSHQSRQQVNPTKAS